MGHASGFRILCDLLRDVVAEQGDHMRAQFLSQIHVGAQTAPMLAVQLLALRRLHHNRSEGAVVRFRHVRRCANSLHVAGVRGHVHQHVLPRLNASARFAALGLACQPIGHAPQRDLAQRRQVLARKEIAERRTSAFGQIYLPRLQALDQVVRLDVHQLHRRRLIENAIGNALGNAHMRDGGYLVVQALKMLDIHRSEHADAGAQQFLDILIALAMAASRSIRVRQFVHEDNLRMALQHRIEIELVQGDVPMPDRTWRNLLQAFHQSHGVHARMRLHIAHHHVEALVKHRMRFFQHGVRFPNARRVTEEDLELAARVALGGFFFDDLPKNGIGVAARFKIAYRCSHSVPSNQGRNGRLLCPFLDPSYHAVFAHRAYTTEQEECRPA